MRPRHRARAALAFAGSAWLALSPAAAPAYPLDGFESTGIQRLEVQRLVQIGQADGRKRPPGELLPRARVDLRLLDRPDLELPEPDPALSARLRRVLGPEASRYGLALLDLSDPARVRYAEWNGRQHQNPGSVGKLMVGLAIFQALADMHPDDVAARERLLRETIVTADVFSVSDHHTVPKWDAENGRLYREPLKIGDQASLWTYLDWMMSPSSNSAAAMLQKQLILMKHFGAAYPPSAEESERFFAETPREELGRIFAEAIQGPIERNGLDLASLRQGSFFTHQGKRHVPGASSYSTPRELVRFMLKMEQGRLVDEWSSRELKRLLYVTERRIRYASSWALRDSAVYFKSGSLYSCEPEEGFVCRKYHGNKRNYMNSVAIVESPAGLDRLTYITAVLSNVLRKNSAEDHRDLARAVHQLLLADHPEPPRQPGEPPRELAFGRNLIGYEEERRELELAVQTQETLSALGYEIGEIDGRIGPATRSGIRAFQKSQGMPTDGHVSEALLGKLVRVATERGALRPDVAAPPPPVEGASDDSGG